MPAKKKKKNALVRYFKPFGLKQVAEITILILAPIFTILGMALFNNVTTVVLPIGLSLFILGGLLCATRSILV
ncbi:MAG: hypothetical protein FWD86_01365, partial [Firmicutes bacterium]|nr:hypothetical protein [Bacillota bacterium]